MLIRVLLITGENVLKALRRLGGNKKPVSTADRWKKKKTAQQPETDEEKTKKELLLKLTGLADSLMTTGDFQVYEKTFEKLSFEIDKEGGMQFADAEPDEPEDEEDDELEAAFKGSTTEDVKAEKLAAVEENKKDNLVVDVNKEVQWFYKTKDDEASGLLGPYSSTQMLKWQDEGKFEGGVHCRKAGQEGSFYNSNRIDFDLYVQ